MTIRFSNTTVKISFLFAFSLTVFALCDRTNIILYNIVSALFHETGHLLSLFFFKEKPEMIRFTPFGMKIQRKSGDTMSFLGETVTALAGPFMNFLLALILFAFQKLWGFRLGEIIEINIVLGALNLLICEPLDGYRALKFIMLKKISEEKTEIFLKISSLIVIFPVSVAGFLVLIKSGYNFSLLLVAVYLCSFIIVRQKR